MLAPYNVSSGSGKVVRVNVVIDSGDTPLDVQSFNVTYTFTNSNTVIATKGTVTLKANNTVLNINSTYIVP